MAITIQQTPSNYSPVYDPIFWVVSSTNVAQANFEYICDLYINGVTFAGGSSYLRLKCPADPTYGRGQFDVSKILRRYVTGDISDSTYGFQQCSNSVVDYSVKFGELYGPSSGVTSYANLTTSLNKTAFNGSIPTLEWNNTSNFATTYAANTSSTPVTILTARPTSGSIVSPSTQWIYAMSQTSGAIKFANISTWDSNGSLISTHRVINHQYHDATTVSNRMVRFPASGYNLNLIPDGNVVSGVQPIIESNAVRWEIYFTDSAHNRITNSFYSSWNTKCTPHTAYHLYFRNKYGAYDTFSFIRASQISTDIKRDKYEKVLGEYKSSSSYTYNMTDRFETNYHTEYKETIKLNSDWITENESIWLQELLTSPDIRTDISGTTLIPVNIIETKYIQRQHKTDKIFNIEVSIQTTYNEIRQGA